MSALQKYKQEAKQLAEENAELREENERLKAGRVPRAEFPKTVDPDELYKRSVELIKEISHCMYDHPGRMAAAVKIEGALIEAFEMGKNSS